MNIEKEQIDDLNAVVHITIEKGLMQKILLRGCSQSPPDVISQILVCLPLILLYEAGIIIARGVEYRRSKEVAKQ